ncbi:MAG: hypothetical protein ACK4SA_24270, partial [Caldilinea sp.]
TLFVQNTLCCVRNICYTLAVSDLTASDLTASDLTASDLTAFHRLFWMDKLKMATVSGRGSPQDVTWMHTPANELMLCAI